MRASLGAALAVLGVVGAFAAGPEAASAAGTTDSFTVVSAGASAANPDQLTVVVDSPSTLTGLTAQFMNGAADAYDQTLTAAGSATDPTDPTQTETTWTADIPAGTSGLPLGSYSITLNGTFSDAGTYGQSDAGSFSFLATAAVTLKAAATDLSYPNASTTMSGQITLTNPDGTADTDYSAPGIELIVEPVGVPYGPTVPIARDGTFSVPDFAPSASESVEAVVSGTEVATTKSAPVALTVTTVTPTLSLKVNPVTETYGKPVTVTGTLSYADGSASTPIAGQPIWVSRTDSSAGALATGTTTASGGFSVPLPEQAAGGTLYVGSAGGTDLATAVAPLTLKVVHPTAISSFNVSLSQYWALTVTGCLGFPAGDKTERITNTSGLTVEYAAAGGYWNKLGVINGKESDQGCGTGGIKFSGSFGAKLSSAYYRVVYAGTTGATSYAATTGNSKPAWRFADRITGFTVSPTVVNAGGKLTIKGTLQYDSRGWRGYAGQTLVIGFHPKGSNPKWEWPLAVKTNSKGQFSVTFKDPGSGTWQVVFDGNNSNVVGHLSTGSPEVYVRLK